MNQKNNRAWIAVVVALLLGAICFSLIHSAWSIVVHGVVVLGIALIYRAAFSRTRR